MLIRLLQAFDGVELAQDEQPLDSRPPAEWSHAAVGNRKRLEKARPKSHLTLYAQVSHQFLTCSCVIFDYDEADSFFSMRVDSG